MLQKLKNSISNKNVLKQLDQQKILLAKILINGFDYHKSFWSLNDFEFKVFSQWGDDGIIQFLINRIKMPKVFIEFGVENYKESNTRFLLINNNWKGLTIDGSSDNINEIIRDEIYFKHDLKAVHSFITKDNINSILKDNKFDGEIGILSVDIDGNDYWVLKEINVVNPVIIIVEYNSMFGPEAQISIPYKEDFVRTIAHYSNLYYGASLAAFSNLLDTLGYSFIGCNSSGNNAYFIRNDKADFLKTINEDDRFVKSKFRESRNSKGDLNFLNHENGLKEIGNCMIYDFELEKTISIKDKFKIT